MGTNTVAFYGDEASGGSRLEAPKWWCTLLVRLPKGFALGLSEALAILRRWGHPQLAACLDETSTTTLPRFLVEGIRSVTDAQWKQWATSSRDVLDHLLVTTAQWLFTCQSQLATPTGLHAQFALQLHRYCGWRADMRHTLNRHVVDTTCATFVASHFATLHAPRDVTDLYFDRDGVLSHQAANGTTYSRWNPTATFPEMASDPWLYLLCGGGIDGRQPPAFQCHSIGPGGLPCNLTMSTADALVAIRTQRASQMPPDPCDDRGSEGNVLEALVSVAVVTASRRNGVGGMSLSRFLCRLAEELILSNAGYRQRTTVVDWCDEISREWVDKLATETMPYLGAVHATWPTRLLDIPHCHFGHFHRSTDMEQVATFSVSVRRATTEGGAATANLAAAPVAVASMSPPVDDQVLLLVDCRTDWTPLNRGQVQAILRRAVDQHRQDAKHRVHLVLASNVAMAPFATQAAWVTWQANHAEAVHLQVARLVLTRDPSHAQTLRLSLAPLSMTMPESPVGSSCDLLVVFIAVEEWLCLLLPERLQQALPLEVDEPDMMTNPAQKKPRTT